MSVKTATSPTGGGAHHNREALPNDRTSSIVEAGQLSSPSVDHGLPPHNAEAEQALLGSLLIDPVAFGRIGSQIDGSAFYSVINRDVFEAIAALWRRGDTPDVVTVCDELERRGRLDDTGGNAYLLGLMGDVPSALNVESYARTVRNKARDRQMVTVAELWARAAYASDVGQAALLEQAKAVQEGIARDVDTPGWPLFTLEDAFRPRPPVEELVAGLFRPGELVILYGAPSTLKTLLLIDVGLAVAGGQSWLPPLPGNPGPPPRSTITVPVLWLDCDNGSKRMHERVEAETRAMELEPGAVPFYYTSMPSPPFNAADTASVDALVRECKALNAGLVVIDNLGVISGDAEENSAEMAHVMANLRRLAEETGACVVVVHHQRKSTGRKGRAGETLRGHSSIEASLDLALLVERQEGQNSVTVKATKSRSADVPPFGALFTYEHREGSSELYSARFFGMVVEDKSKAARGTRAILAVLEASAEPPNKEQLIRMAHAGVDGIGLNFIRAQIDELVAQDRVAVRPGPRTSRLYSLVAR